VIKIFKRRKKSDRRDRPAATPAKTARAGTSGRAKSAAARLARSEQRYRALIETMNEGFCVLQMLFDEAGHPSDYRFLETNPAFVKHTGLEAAIGKTARELAPGLEPSWFERYGRVALTGEPAHFVDHAEPLGRWFDVDAFRIGEPGDRQVALLFTDITEQRESDRKLRDSEAELRFILEAANFGSWAMDLTGPPPHPAVRSLRHDQIFGYESSCRSGTTRCSSSTFSRRIVRMSRKVSGRRWPRIATGNSSAASVARTAKSAGSGPRAISCQGRAGQPRRMLGLVTDITTRKQAEEAMRESDRHKDEFIAMLAHELRNPLAAIRTAVGVLASRRDASPVADEMSAIIARQSFQLARLIDDLLDVSRVSRGTLTLQKAAIDVRTIVQQAVEDSSTACRRKGLKVTAAVPEEPVLVDADPVRMTQVVNNLVQNACQFTPKGGSIHVAVERDRR
jgi:PAS domain S-box-containing protein